jgi:hypothetical protein
MTEELERDLKGSGRGLIRILSRHLPAGTEETSVRIAAIPTDIRTEYLRNKSIEC